jgi:cephalosporin-C deacetylase-like acetyl esterase
MRRLPPLLFLAAVALPAQDQLDFLQGLSDYRQIERMLPDALNARAYELLDERDAEVARLRSAEDVAARGRRVREAILDMIGGLPSERTPLNAKIVATLEQPGFVIEKILFESRPGFVVAANLYRPASGDGPFPAVLYPLGHEPGGKAYPVWQQMLGALAQKGYVALTWDPLGQGERVQLWDGDFGRSKIGSSTVEHTLIGAQAMLVGENVAQYTIWDGIRAMDYLVSRPEVDASRVAVTGNSGGGTHTAYLAALDDRLAVAAPSCYITSWRRLLATIGPQDGEQCLLPLLAHRIDHPDYALAFAPKPFHILSAIRDFFSIQGARSSYAELRDVYGRIDQEQKIAMTEGDDGHGYSKPRRMAAYRWFARWLRNDVDDGTEPEVPILTEQELWASDKGQVSVSPGSKSVWDFLIARLNSILADGRGLPLIRTADDLPGYRQQIAARVTEKTAYRAPSGPPQISPLGSIERGGYVIEKLTYASDAGVFVPALLYLPDGGRGRKPATLLVHERGKTAEADRGAELAGQGRIVLAIDARGWGETGYRGIRTGSAFETWFGPYDTVMTAFLIGDTLVGLRARDIVLGLELLRAREDVDSGQIDAVGVGRGTVPLLHAAALSSDFAALRLERPLISYEAVLRQRVHQRILESVVPGALESYDLPQIAAAFAPKPLTIVDPLTPTGEVAAKLEAEAAYLAAQKAYERAGSANAFQLVHAAP